MSARSRAGDLLGDSIRVGSMGGSRTDHQVGRDAFERVHGRSAWQYRSEHPNRVGRVRRLDGGADGGSRRRHRRRLRLLAIRTRRRCRRWPRGTSGRDPRRQPEARGTLSPTTRRSGWRAGTRPDACGRGSFFESVPVGADAYVLKSSIIDDGRRGSRRDPPGPARRPSPATLASSLSSVIEVFQKTAGLDLDNARDAWWPRAYADEMRGFESADSTMSATTSTRASQFSKRG